MSRPSEDNRLTDGTPPFLPSSSPLMFFPPLTMANKNKTLAQNLTNTTAMDISKASKPGPSPPNPDQTCNKCRVRDSLLHPSTVSPIANDRSRIKATISISARCRRSDFCMIFPTPRLLLISIPGAPRLTKPSYADSTAALKVN